MRPRGRTAGIQAPGFRVRRDGSRSVESSVGNDSAFENLRSSSRSGSDDYNRESPARPRRARGSAADMSR